MENLSTNILSILIFLPLLGSVVIVLLPEGQKALIKWAAFSVSLIELAFAVGLFFMFKPGAEMQFELKVPWIASWGISYHVGIDGISFFLILLTAFLTSISIVSSWTAISKSLRGYMVSMLIMETGMIGVFASLDLFLFYVFWEAMLIPMYFLIGIWGGPNRIYATVKFFIYTMVGSVLMLVAILVLHFMGARQLGFRTMDLLQLYQVHVPLGVQNWLFLAFALSFAIKVPLFPFHTWLPDAHVEAPTAGSVILAGVLLKMGGYGLLRFCFPLFPNATEYFTPLFMTLAVIGIIYGALVAMVQPDIKKLVAYSSVSHMGFVVLGIFALNLQGLQGGILQMLNHGLSTGALFLLVGVIYERRHTRLIQDFGGISKVMPIFAVLFMIITLSSIGLPGLNGFVGEFLILLGAARANFIFTIFAASGVIFAAVYMLWMFKRVMFGKIVHDENKRLKDMNLREILYMIPILVFVVWIGVYPSTFLSRMEPSVTALMNLMEKNKVETVQVSSTTDLTVQAEEVSGK